MSSGRYNSLLDMPNEDGPVKYDLLRQEDDPDIVMHDNRLMPHFETRFWGIYGNKLRVFGTKETVCHLSSTVVDS